MSKKDFSGGLNSLLGETPERPQRGRPKTSTRVITKSSQEGTKDGETRATFVVNEGQLETIKNIAYWEGYNQTVKNKQPTTVFIKDVLREALQEYIDRYKKKNGAIKPMPNK